MNKNTVSQLLKKYAEGNCSPEEQALVDRWYLSEASKRTGIDPKKPIEEHDLIWKGLQTQLALSGIDAEVAEAYKPAKTARLLSLKWIVAASIVLVASLVLYRIATSDNHETLMAEIRKNDIAPGKNTATLTLADGKTISLSDEKTGVVIDATNLKYADGTNIASLREGTTKQSKQDSHDEIASSRNASRNDVEMNKNEMAQLMKGAAGVSIESWKAFSRKMLSVNTPRGGTYQVLLPDRSKVWLNAASSLSFPQQFDKKARVVMLIGEAYFEIAKNPDQPFRVMSIGQRVTVLGTHFNINAYRDERVTKTTLIEGSVQVYAGASSEEVTLKPGQQAIMNYQDLKTAQANIEEVLAWKNGKFRFVNEDIKSIMGKISRWYDVDIEYRGDVTREKFSGQVSRFGNVSDILEVLQLTGFVHFKIENQAPDAKNPGVKKPERRIVVLP